MPSTVGSGKEKRAVEIGYGTAVRPEGQAFVFVHQ